MFAGIIGIIALGLFFFAREFKKAGKNETKVIELEKENKGQNVTIQQNKEVRKRQTINNSVPSSDNVIWLFDNFCTDCNK